MNNYNTTKEIWKDIKGFEGAYQVSNLGRVRSLDRKNSRGQKIRGKVLQEQNNTKGYLYISLYKGSRDKRENRYIHRLVAEAFIPPFNGETVNHKDGDKNNNVISNLEWATQSENIKHAYENNLIKRALRVRAEYPNGKVKEFNNMVEASLYFGFSRNWIRDRREKSGDETTYKGIRITVLSN